MADKFRVFMFHADGTSTEETLQPVESEEAVRKAVRLVRNAQLLGGSIQRVIITDQDDITAFEWTYDKGLVFPSPQIPE